MAVIAATMEMLERGTLHLWSWRNLRMNDSGDPVEWSRLSDRSVHVYGTFGGATVMMQGSNDGANYPQLDNLKGLPIAITADAVSGLLQLTAYVRPMVVGGDGTTSLNVLMLARGMS